MLQNLCWAESFRKYFCHYLAWEAILMGRINVSILNKIMTKSSGFFFFFFGGGGGEVSYFASSWHAGTRLTHFIFPRTQARTQGGVKGYKDPPLAPFFLLGLLACLLACLSEWSIRYNDTPTPCLGNWLNVFWWRKQSQKVVNLSIKCGIIHFKHFHSSTS